MYCTCRVVLSMVPVQNMYLYHSISHCFCLYASHHIIWQYAPPTLDFLTLSFSLPALVLFCWLFLFSLSCFLLFLIFLSPSISLQVQFQPLFPAFQSLPSLLYWLVSTCLFLLCSLIIVHLSLNSTYSFSWLTHAAMGFVGLNLTLWNVQIEAKSKFL